MTGLPLITLTIFSPLIGALLIAFLPRERTALVRRVALAASLVSFAFSLLLVAAFNGTTPDAAGFRFV
ncbi:MAG: NADH-quinone oxidoreductase subunit M, partial [Candidatus Limnocylindrales bacterium]